MTVDKLSLSFDHSLAERARQAARSGGHSLSAFVAEAVEHKLKLEQAGRLIADWEAEHGQIPEEALAEAGKHWRD